MTKRLQIAIWLACGLACFSLRARGDEPGSADAPRSIDAGFRIEHYMVDPAGKTALVWGTKGGYHPNEKKGNTLLLVDLDRQKVLATREEPSRIELACLDAKYVYLVPGGEFRRLDRADLTKEKTVAIEGEPRRIEALPGGKVAVFLSNESNASLVAFDCETLERDPQPPAKLRLQYSRLPAPPAFERGVGGTLIYPDRIVDATTGELRAALEANDLPPLVDSAARKNPIAGRWPAPNVLWGRTVRANAITDADARPIVVLGEWNTMISPFDPLAVNVSYYPPNSRQLKAVLQIREIKQGTILRSFELGPSVVGYSPGADFGQQLPTPALQIFQNHVLYRDGTQLFIWPIPDELKKKAPTPLTLMVPAVPPASVDSPLEVQFSARGGEGTPTFSLPRKYDGLAIDAASGKVTVDLPKLWKTYLAGGAEPATPFASHVVAAAATPDTRPLFKRLTGRPLPDGKMAFRLPLRVVATDAAGDSDELRLAAIAIAPKDEAEKVATRVQAEKAARRIAARARIERAREEARARAENALLKLPAAAGEGGPGPVRSFHDPSGRALEAAYLGVVDGKVQLRRSDGKLFALSPDKLSEADRQWLKQQAVPAKERGGDYAALRGVWECKEFLNNGRPDIFAMPVYIVFAEDSMKVTTRQTASLYKYGLDPTATPKRCDMVAAKPGTGTFHSIYSLESGKLRLCMPSAPQNFDEPIGDLSDYPKDVTPGPGRLTFICTKAAQQPAAGEASLTPPQKAALQALRADLAQSAKLLDDKKYAEFLERFVSPRDRDALKQQPNGLENATKMIKKDAAVFTNWLKALSTAVPAFDAAASRATYDFRTSPTQTQMPPTAIFIKVGDRWYFTDRP